VALTVQRDLDVVVAGFLGWLTDRRDAEVVAESVARPTEGWSSETVLVHTRIDGVAEGHAVRLAPLGEGIFPAYDLSLQARAQAGAADRAVPAPVPAEVVDDPAWLGEPFLVMPLVDGHVPGEMAAFDPWVRSLAPATQRGLYGGVADALATLHTADPPGDLPHRSVEADLASWTDYLAWYADGDEAAPALAEALAWCGEHRPATEPAPAFLWGDVRMGNVVFTDDGSVAAVLDWEMATVGAPEHDLGWWWGLEVMQDEMVGGRADAFPQIAELRARYESGLGRPLQDLPWFETFALFRSAAILTRIGIVQQRAGLTPRLPLHDNPVLDHLIRRLEEPP
jgi:aminoglycoside phosphotransferase (APT) family kinase protein